MMINFEKWNSEIYFDENTLGLWVFNINDKDVCFWGHYNEVLKTLHKFIEKNGLKNVPIYVIDCIQYNNFFREEKLTP